MSHVATKWAFDQPEVFRDMKPAEWAVLVILADCHNPVNGCFPSQDYIASRTNLSERAVRDHLGRLRERQLIEFEVKREEGRRASNRYKLAFESDFQPAESAGSSSEGSTGKNEHKQPADSDQNNRQNLPPNPVREPVSEPVTLEREGAREAKKPDPQPEDDHEFQKLLKRYPGTNSPNLAFPPWQRLDDDGRRRALARLDAYLADLRKVGRTHPFALQRYLSERLFDQVDEPADGKPVPTIVRPRTDEWWALFWRRRKAGERVGVMLDQAKGDGAWGCAIDALPDAAEIASLAEIETGSEAFRAWVTQLAREGLRLGGEACGRFIKVPSEFPPGHDPPESQRYGERDIESESGWGEADR